MLSTVRRNWAYLRPLRRKLGYIGWLGHDNVGDEAMYIATRRLFAPWSVLPLKITSKTRLAERLVPGYRIFRGVLLGGGTLICAGYDRQLKDALLRYPRGIAFGSGVRNPAYWSRHVDFSRIADNWQEVLEALEMCTVRGPVSKRLVEKLGRQDAVVIGDPALSLADESIREKSGEKRIGLNVGVSGGKIWGNEENVLEWTVRLIDLLVDQGWKVTLFPAWAKDVDYVRHVRRRASGSIDMFEEFLELEALLNFLRRCDVVVGEKLHSVILAHCTFTPALMLEYRPKCRDYMLSVGQEDFVLRTDELSLEKALTAISVLADDGLAIQRSICDRVNHYRGLQRRTVREAKDLLGSGSVSGS